MSTTIDERVVEMRFDNKQFENGVQTSLLTLERLKQGLNLSGAAKGLENVSAAAKNINFSGLSSGIETIHAKISAMEVMAITALANITNSVINAGKRIGAALTIEPVRSGFSEYETQINAIQTILANTESKGSTLEDVNAALDELNKYADQTIYNFTEMTRNIGTFTAAGVDLDTSVSAIKGIANLAAVSGSTSQQASTAMYQLSQALASGTVKLMDWNSVVNAGMGGQVFQDALKETARVHGVAIDAMIKSEGSFRETLKDGWLTSEILTETLSKFTGDLNEEQLRTMGYTDEQIQSIIKMGNTANNAATKVKTFTQLFDTLKEAAQSGWTQSWETIVGDFEQAKETLSEMSVIFGNIINNTAKARNSLLEGWKELGGREKLIEGFKNAFNAIASVVVPVKEAFRDIFPKTTAEQLYSITTGISNFIKSIQLSSTQTENLKRTFKGLFAVLDIVKQAFSAVWNNLSPLLGGVGVLGDGILSITAVWGDWLVELNNTIKTSDIFNDVLQKVISIITTGFTAVKGFAISATEAVKGFVSSIKDKFDFPGFEIFHKFLEKVQNRVLQVGDGVGKMGDSFTGAFKAMYSAIASSSLVGVLKGIWNLISIIAGGISKALSGAITGLANALGSANFDNFLDMINTISLGGIAVGISKFVKSVSGTFDGVSGILEGVTDTLDGVRGCFEAYQTQLKAGTLLKIAGAIAILTASILVISTIDSDKLATSLGVVTGLFAELMASMAIFSHISGSMGKTTKACVAMIAMSAAVAILAGAMKSLSTLDWNGVIKGLVSIAGLSAIVVASAKILSSGSGQLVKGASSLVIFAAAIKVLASACIDLSTLSWNGLVKGLAGVGVLLGEVSIFLNTAKFSGKAISTATGMLILSGAIKVLASACADFGAMSWSEIGKGLTSIGVLLTELMIFTNLTGNAKHIISTGASLVLIGAAMKIFASAVSDFGSMGWDAIGRGLTAMGIALAEVAIAVHLMPKNLMITGASLVVVGAALNILATALGKMGSMTWEEIGKGLLTMGVALAELAIGLHLMMGALPGAAALIVAAGAIAILAPALSLIGAMSWESIIKGLVTVAGAFTILGVAGLVLTPLIPSILALAGAFALIGVGVVAVGAGLLAAGVGLQALALGFTALGAMGAAGATAVVAALTVIVTGIVALIPAVVNKIGEALVLFAQAIIVGAPIIVEAVVVLIGAIVTALVTSVPQIVDGVLLLLTSTLEAIVKYTPRIIKAVMDIIVAILDGIASNLPSIIQAGVDIVVSLIRGIGQTVPQLVDAGFKMIIDFINGIAESIRTNTPLLVDSMKNLTDAMLDAAITILTGGNPEFIDAGINVVKGFAKGIAESVGQVVEAAKELGESALKSLREFLGINSPAKETIKDGEFTGEGFAIGMDNSNSAVNKSAKKMGETANSTLMDTIYGGTEKLSAYMKKSDKESIEQKKDYWSDLVGVTEEGVEEQKEIQNEAVTNTEDTQKRITTSNKKTVEEEQSHWEKLLAVHKNGVDAKKYKDMELAEFEKEILSETTDIWSDYTDALVSKNNSIVNQIGLFSAVEKKEEVKKETLTKNLNDQIKEYESFAYVIANLNSRISDGNFKNALNEMSIDSLAELRTLNKMTDEELTQYAQLYEYKYALARHAATTQLDSLQAETEQKLSNLYGGVNVNLTDFAATFDGSMGSITDYVKLSAEQAAIAKDSGVRIGTGTAEGIVESTAVVNQAATDMIDGAEQSAREAAEIHSPSGLFRREVGSYLTEGMALGMTDKKFMVMNSSTQLISGALTVLRNARASFVIAGQNASVGFAEGIFAKVSDVANAAAEVANAAFSAAQAAIDSHSPSRRFMELGQFADEGFVIGLRNYSDKVSNASYEVGAGAINTMSDILSNISSVIENEIDSEPTIKPVLDLSNVTSGTRRLSTMLSYGNALSVSAEMRRNNHAQDSATSQNPMTSGNTYNMIQNNYSPKALSRIDIYRQTKNLFGTMKGTVSGA